MAQRSPGSPTFKLRGPAETSISSPALPLSDLKGRATVLAEFRPSASRAAAMEQTVAVDPDAILEIELEDGQLLWISGQDYRERFAAGQDLVLAPIELAVSPNAMDATQTRGPVSWAVKALKVVGIDLAGITALELGKLVDKRTSPDKRPGLGLFECRPETGAFSLVSVHKQGFRTDQPHLLFLHGPGGSTWGSFGDLWSNERATELGALRNAYGAAILGFEHGSLTVSPVRNALDLLETLPKSARLHLLSHSRGGLIGEILCRGRNTQGSPFDVREIEIYRRALEARSEELNVTFNIDEPVAELEELNRRLAEVRPVVERFVRVACPALGTTLASERLDRWLSVIGNIGGMALPASPLAEWFADIADFMAAVIAKRTNPATLPGLEAMMPDSGLIRVLNYPDARVEGDLTVIAGDIGPDEWWAKLLLWATDKFYGGDHDLVVNTPSMFGGARRTGTGLASVHRGETVNHFSYFSNKSSAEAVVRGLTQSAETLSGTAGFEPLVAPQPSKTQN